MERYGTLSPDASSGNFKFKYVAEEELLRIVRKVRREKQKEKDALLWKRFIEDRDKNKNKLPDVNHANVDEFQSTPSSCHICNETCNEGEKHPMLPNAQTEPLERNIPLDGLESAQLPLKRLSTNDGAVTARETGTLQRIALLRHRISLALDSITGMVQCRPAEPDGPDDLERRKTRLNEFLSRFSRNYLFQFQRQVTELQRHVASASPETPGRHTEYQALMQKLVSAHQTALQSLQAYLSQIPASLQVTNIFGKLKHLLHYLCDLSSLKSQLDVHAGIIDGCEDLEDIDEVYLKCRELLTLLEEKRSEPEDVSVSGRASSPLSAKGSLNPKPNRVLVRTNAGVHQNSWKKTSAFLARTKFGVPSSVRSSVSARVSSRGRHSHQEKTQKDSQTYNCCNSELKEIITHMHEVLCNKVVEKKKKSRHRTAESTVVDKSKAKSLQKPVNLVQNLSKNVQLVITQHCDSESDGYKDAATDTADLNEEHRKSNFEEEENKKPKRVVWAPGDSSLPKNTAHPVSLLADLNTQGDRVKKLMKAPEHHVFSYRQRFHEYNAKVQSTSIQRCCEEILDGVFHEISEELEPSFLLKKMYHLEFKDP